ncbi:MAG: AMP-binding protein [Saprospiraceae bacterium]|nr:AMP-binding protein [Candidatus Brachybacter algidus]MBL0117442.1 AMP-binding protein [Candidatus Brachybacter algidus]
MNTSFSNIKNGLEIDLLSSSELNNFQFELIRNTLISVNDNSTYYSNLFKEINFDVLNFNDISTFKKIPFSTKEILQEFNSELLNVPIKNIAEYVTTSGTLGAPVQFLLTENDLDRLAYNEARGLSIAGVTSDDVVQITTTLDRRFMAGLAYYVGCRMIGAGTIRVGVGAPQLQWDTIAQMSPTVIIGVPSFIVKLIEFAIHNNIDINASSVKKIICIGEPIRDIELELNKVGQFIKSQWNVQLFSTYASTEMATAFTECEFGQGGHQLNELIYTEIIDEDGNDVLENEIGELVVTTLQVEGMPLLRFRTGDMVRKYNAPCKCGRKSSRLGPIVGRKGQLIKYKGTSVYPSALQHILDHMAEVETYVIEAILNDFGEDQINVLIAISGDKEIIINKLKELCQSYIRVTPEFLIREAGFINHLRNRPEMRKPILFIDNRR